MSAEYEITDEKDMCKQHAEAFAQPMVLLHNDDDELLYYLFGCNNYDLMSDTL